MVLASPNPGFWDGFSLIANWIPYGLGIVLALCLAIALALVIWSFLS